MMSADLIERKLAAILAADVSGYSRMVEVDEAGTLARVKAHIGEVVRPTIAAHRFHRAPRSRLCSDAGPRPRIAQAGRRNLRLARGGAAR